MIGNCFYFDIMDIPVNDGTLENKLFKEMKGYVGFEVIPWLWHDGTYPY